MLGSFGPKGGAIGAPPKILTFNNMLEIGTQVALNKGVNDQRPESLMKCVFSIILSSLNGLLYFVSIHFIMFLALFQCPKKLEGPKNESG